MATRRKRPGRSKQRPTLRRKNTALILGLCALVLLWRWWPGKSAPVVSDSEALARVIQSEIGHGSRKQQLHVAWTARNLASERGQSMREMVCSPCGAQGRKRPLSSRQKPTEAHRALARRVLGAPQGRDPTGGATHFLNPRLQDKLAAKRKAGYRNKGYRAVRRKWRRDYGWQRYYRLGPTLEFWGPRKRKSKRRSAS